MANENENAPIFGEEEDLLQWMEIPKTNLTQEDIDELMERLQNGWV